MGRNKGIQTNPKNAGKVANTPEFDGRHKQDDTTDNLIHDLIPLMKRAYEMRATRGTNWTPMELQTAICEYFEYCASKDLKPSMSGLRLWLGISYETLSVWLRHLDKYGTITEIMRDAKDCMEVQYINRAEKYPTANIFMLKSKHGYVEKTQVEINSNQNITTNEVDDVIKRLNLDKPSQ